KPPILMESHSSASAWIRCLRKRACTRSTTEPAITRRFVSSCLMFVLTLSVCRAADEPKKPEGRVKAGRGQRAGATIVRREAPDKPWQVVKEFDSVSTGDLLITGSQGSVLSANGGARLTAIGSMTGVPEFPILETGVIFHEPKDVDLDFTLDRGRVDLI